MDRRHFGQLLASTVILGASGASAADRWPSWRGTHRDGFIPEKAFPKSLDESTLVRRWTVPLDTGYSGPIIEGDRVIVTETRNKKLEVVSALDRGSGKEIWKTEWEGAMTVPFFAKSNGDWIRSTPASDSKRLFVAGMRDLLVCLQLETGEVLWKVDFPTLFKSPLPDFGFVCSPLVDGDFVVVQAGASLCKLEASTGKVVWRSLADGGGMNGSAFSSPIIAEIKGVRQYLVQTRTKLCGIDPSTGKDLWSKEIEAFRGMNILTPTVWQDQVFTSSYGGKSWLFDLEPSDQSAWVVRTKWEQKSQGYMSSPLVIGSHLYMHLRNQRFICLDLQSGKETWTSRPFGKYWSMVANKDQILALDERGILMLIAADPTEFKILSERKVSDEECWAHLAVVDNQIFVRHLKGISLFEWASS